MLFPLLPKSSSNLTSSGSLFGIFDGLADAKRGLLINLSFLLNWASSFARLSASSYSSCKSIILNLFSLSSFLLYSRFLSYTGTGAVTAVAGLVSFFTISGYTVICLPRYWVAVAGRGGVLSKSLFTFVIFNVSPPSSFPLLVPLFYESDLYFCNISSFNFEFIFS